MCISLDMNMSATSTVGVMSTSCNAHQKRAPALRARCSHEGIPPVGFVVLFASACMCFACVVCCAGRCGGEVDDGR